MNKTAHTPGPYHAQNMAMSQEDWNSMYDGVTAIVTHGCDVLAAVWHEDETPEAEMAQAKLFAAAPELLEALKEFAALEVKGHALIDRLQFSEDGCALSAKITAAIAKAEGMSI